MEKDIKIVFIGAEKNNLPSIKKIIDGLPKLFNFPVFVCVPYIKSYKINFIKYLSNDNVHVIKEPCHDEKLENGKIYVASPQVHTFINNASFFISREQTKYYSQPSIDLSLISFAEYYRQNLCAIIFPGNSKDGIFGIKRVKLFNGEILLSKELDSNTTCDCKCYSEIIGNNLCYDITQILKNITNINQYAEY